MKLIDLSHLPVTWTQIGTISRISTGFIDNNFPFTCIVNGYFSVFYPLGQGANPSNSRGAILFSFDGLGNMCTYQTSDFSPTGNQDTLCRPYQIWQSGNTLVYALLNGGTWKMSIPKIFTPGATYILPPIQFPTPPPCGAGTYQKTIFCGQQGLYCNEFIQDFPESDNYWASIYDTTGNLIKGGFIGNASTDLFDQRSLSLPPFVDGTEIYDRNGLVVYGNFGSVSNINQVVGSGINWLNGNAGDLICGSVPLNPVFVTEKNPTQIYYNRDYGMPGFSSSPDNVIRGSTDLLGSLLYPDFSNGNVLLSSNYFIKLPTKASSNQIAYLSSTKQLFNTDIDPFFQVGAVYVASLDLSPFGPPPNVTRGDFPGLANYHRAVSPRGIFQA